MKLQNIKVNNRKKYFCPVCGENVKIYKCLDHTLHNIYECIKCEYITHSKNKVLHNDYTRFYDLYKNMSKKQLSQLAHKLQNELNKLKDSNRKLWQTYGSELSSGSMIYEEMNLSKKLQVVNYFLSK